MKYDTNSASSIIDWYSSYTIEMGIDPLLTARQHLSIAYYKIATAYKDKEVQSKRLYSKRKISEAVTKLETTGTMVLREAEAIRVNKELRMEESTLEGEVMGTKQILNSYSKVLDSMASIISTLNR